MTTRLRPADRPLATLLALFVALGIIYAWATPPLEASDELWHFGMVDAVADTGALPVQAPGVTTPWEQEGSQPPLYYMLAAGLVNRVERSDFDALRAPNPHVKAGVPGAADNKNLVLHDTPHPPPRGAALAVYLLRAAGILLGAVTVAAVYGSARLLSGSGIVALTAAGLTAFNPMFLFISASVNNDTLVTALNSLLVWHMLVLLRDGFSGRRSFVLAALFALASLTKLSALVLGPVVALAALWVARRRRDWRGLLALAALALGLWMLIAGWWYARNLTLYGELFGTGTMVAVAGPRLEPFGLQTLVDEFEGFRVGYWGWFGAVNITTAPAFYAVMDAAVVLALAGLAVYAWRRRNHGARLVPAGLLALAFVVGSLSLLGWTAQTYASQGRLLFPLLAAISPLLALGWVTLARAASPRLARLPLAGVGALGLFALAVPFVTIAPRYAPPERLNALPDSAEAVYARFDAIELVGYETPGGRYGPGDTVPLTVYWRVRERSDRDLSLYLHAVDHRGDVVGRVDSFPGGGRLRTTTWAPGAVYADHYRIPLDAAPGASARLRVQVGWWHYASGEVVQPVDESGAELESVMLDAGGYAGADRLPADVKAIDPVSFGGVVALDAYSADRERVTLVWRATGTPDADYTVFVQVVDEAGEIVGQGDAPPDLPTRYWRPGDMRATVHRLNYVSEPAPGAYRVLVGWYEPVTGARLDTASPDDAYPLATLVVD